MKEDVVLGHKGHWELDPSGKHDCIFVVGERPPMQVIPPALFTDEMLEQIRAVVREELETVLGSSKPEELIDVPTYTIGTTITGDEPCSWCGEIGIDGSNTYCRRCKKWYCSLHLEAH